MNSRVPLGVRWCSVAILPVESPATISSLIESEISISANNDQVWPTRSCKIERDFAVIGLITRTTHFVLVDQAVSLLVALMVPQSLLDKSGAFRERIDQRVQFLACWHGRNCNANAAFRFAPTRQKVKVP